MTKKSNDFYKYENCAIALCIHATIDPETHLILNAQINLLSAITLVDSGATGVFMHSKFAQECNA
jgi:predicted aspartyl protease